MSFLQKFFTVLLSSSLADLLRLHDHVLLWSLVSPYRLFEILKKQEGFDLTHIILHF